MKNRSAVWINDFDFNDTQREQLLRVWPRISDRENALIFIDEIRGCLKTHMGLFETKTKTDEKRDRLNDIIKHSNGLIKSFNNLPDDMVGELNAGIKESLYFSKQNRFISESLKAASCVMNGNNDYPGVVEMAGIIHDWLILISDEAQKIAAVKGKAGKNKSREMSLVSQLAKIYYKQFKKAPSSKNNSNFRNFISELSNVLNMELGSDVVKNSLIGLGFIPKKMGLPPQ